MVKRNTHLPACFFVLWTLNTDGLHGRTYLFDHPYVVWEAEMESIHDDADIIIGVGSMHPFAYLSADVRPLFRSFITCRSLIIPYTTIFVFKSEPLQKPFSLHCCGMHGIGS